LLQSPRFLGGAAHAGRMPETKQFHMAFQLAHLTFITTIGSGELPDINVLLERWKNRN